MKEGQRDSHMKGQGMAKTKEKRKKKESPVRYIKAEDKENEDSKKKEGGRGEESTTDRSSTVHCGVVGNMQASHVCAPGSIPGDGILYSYS